MRFERCGFSPDDLQRYCTLFGACFPSAAKLRQQAYLQWLYVDNPLGPAIGFNAIEGERLAAHYICTRALIRFEGRTVPALLSLNTATHPDFQGRGLFTKLAELTYAAGAAEGAALVYGVANANSTPGFVRKLGFGLVEPLESRIGIGALGRFDWKNIAARARFRQDWRADYLEWRLSNPANRARLEWVRPGGSAVSAPAGRPLLRAWAEIPEHAEHAERVERSRGLPGGRVWLGLVPSGAGRFGSYAPLPRRLRPSPLNLIFRSLDGSPGLGAGESLFSFLDFDAF